MAHTATGADRRDDREEREGRIGWIHDELYVTTGNVMPVMRAKQFGRKMAADLRSKKVDAVLLSAT